MIVVGLKLSTNVIQYPKFFFILRRSFFLQFGLAFKLKSVNAKYFRLHKKKTTILQKRLG